MVKYSCLIITVSLVTLTVMTGPQDMVETMEIKSLLVGKSQA